MVSHYESLIWVPYIPLLSVDLVEPGNSLAKLPSVSLKAEPQESQRCNVQQMGVAQQVGYKVRNSALIISYPI